MSGRYYTNAEAAKVIRNFVATEGEDDLCERDPWAWDDLENNDGSNPDVFVALILCYQYAERFPSTDPHKYCGDEAMPYFLEIAHELENNELSVANVDEVKAILQQQKYSNEVVDFMKRIDGRISNGGTTKASPRLGENREQASGNGSE